MPYTYIEKYVKEAFYNLQVRWAKFHPFYNSRNELIQNLSSENSILYILQHLEYSKEIIPEAPKKIDYVDH